MKFLQLFLILVNVPLAGAEVWSLPAPLENRSKPYACLRTVGEGMFQLKARLTLEKLDGTAASVWFGDELNFGFDSRGEHLFVEGRAVGNATKQLEPSSRYLQPGRPFEFLAVRSGSGETIFSINQNEVYRTDKLKDLPLSIRFRPHRNIMDVKTVELRGDLNPPPPPLQARVRRVPVLRGTANPLLEMTLHLEQARTLGGFVSDFQGNPDVQATWLSLDDTSMRNVSDETFVLPPGLHKVYLQAFIKADADLSRPLKVSFEGLRFADGGMVQPDEGEVRGSFRLAHPIHRQGEVDCHTTRIPGLARTVNGTLLGVYDLRYNSSRDLQEHIDIGLSRSTDGGQTWERPRPIMDMGEYGGKPQKENGCSDPNILVDPVTGKIFVSAVWTYGKPNTHQWQGRGSEPGFDIGRTAQFMVVMSEDDGVTWSRPQNWTRQLKQKDWWLFAPAPGNGIALQDTTLIMPTQGRDAMGHPFSNLMWSQDHGQTWTVSKPARSDTTECAVALLSDGSLMLNMRDNRNRSDKSATNGRAVSVTSDFGRTWKKHSSDHGALPEPTCMASLISHPLSDGRRILLFSNPLNRHERSGTTIQISFDDGQTWPDDHHILLDEGRNKGYSSLVMVDEVNVGILYESSRANLVFQRISLAELLQAH